MEMTPAERFVELIREREIERASALPDTDDNRLIRALVTGRRVWVDLERLFNLQRLATENPIGGAFVECGVAMGGCLAVMAAADPARVVWGFDSFEGMPELTEADGGSGEPWIGVRCAGPEGVDAVAETFRLGGVAMDNVRLVAGWFEDTLASKVAEIGDIAILRVDVDWHQATKFVLETLYDSVVPGGVVIIDDYGSFTGCRRAVDEFRARRGIDADLQFTPDTPEAYWFA